MEDVKADSGSILKQPQPKSTFGMTLQRISELFNRGWGAAVFSVLEQAPE